MKEFWWSIAGSGILAGGVTFIANDQFNQHWNFAIVWLIVFAAYWFLRAGGDIGDAF